MKWLNFGGGHHITREGYDIALLERCICDMKEKYDLEIFLEPGEAVALNAGVLLTKVEEIVENSIQIAILDTSAACHMPDVLEMPYRPPLQYGYEAEEKAYTRWSKTIHSMECVCRQLYWKIRMENAGWFDSSDTKILR